MKELDLILNMLANLDFTAADFQTAGFTAENTSLRPEEDYLNSSKITERAEFLDNNGNFDKAKFHNFYIAAGYFYNLLANLDYYQAVLDLAQYSKDNRWVEPLKRTLDFKPKLVRLPNEHLVTNSLETIGKKGQRTLSQSEIALTQKVYNVETGEWTDSPNDSFFDNFSKTLVLATYDEDVYDEDGELLYQKGERKLNEDGLPYYETLGARNIYGKLVLNKFNTLTVDDSAWNRFDFFDTDDIEQKSFVGTVMRNAALVGSMFIPYVGPWIAGISVATLTAGILANLAKIAYGDDDATLNNIIGWTKSVNRQGLTEYAALNTWCWENIINMIGDSVGQLKEQRWVFNKAAPILSGNMKAYKALKEGAKGKKNYDDIVKKMSEELSEKGAAKTAADFLKDGTITGRNLAEMKVASNAFIQMNKQKAMNMLDEIINDATSFGGYLSMAYMTGLVIQDTYSEAIAAGASKTEAAILTLGYAAAEMALLNSNLGKWIIPEMDMKKFRREAIAKKLGDPILKSFKNATSSNDKKTLAKKLINIGKEIKESEYAKLALSGTKTIALNAATESLEEISEELLSDFSKSTLNAVRWLRGEDPLNMGQWENMFDRYGMSALGGFVGGGITSAGTTFTAYRDVSNMDATLAMHELIYMVNNDQDEDFIKSLDKMIIGNKHLSALKIIDYNDNGEAIYGEGSDEDNLDLYIKDFVKKQIKLVRDILTSEGAKISTTSLLNRLTLEDQEEFVKYHKYANLQNSKAMSLYLLDFAEIQSKLVAAKALLHKLENSTTDAEKREDSFQEKLKKANEEVDKLRIKLEAYTKNTIAPEAIRDAIYELNPIFHNAYVKTNFKLFAKAETGKEWEQLSKEELKRVLENYKTYSETTAKNNIHTSAAIFQNMMELYTPNVEAALEFVLQLKEDGILYLNLVDVILNLITARLGDDVDAYLQQVLHFLNNMERNAASGLTTPFMSLETGEKIFEILNEVVPEDVASDPELLRLYNKEKETRLDLLIFGELATNLDGVVSEFINMGYIHPEVKKALIDTLNALSSKSDELVKYQMDMIFNHPEMYSDILTELDRLTLELQKREKDIKQYIEEIENLSNTPIIQFLNQFQLSTTETDLNIVKHLLKVFDFLDESKQLESIDELFLEDGFIEDNEEAIVLLNSFISVIEGMKVDNADIINPTGYSKILNEVYLRLGIKNYVKLAELDSDTANMIILDAQLIRDRLLFIKNIHDINKGQKLKEHDVVAVNKNFLIYNQTRRLINVIPEDWIGDDSGTSAKDVLWAVHNQLDILKNLTLDNLRLPKELRKLANIEMVKLENAIYDIFKRNFKGDYKQLKEIIHNFAGVNGFFHKTGEVLNTGTTSIDDNAYLWWLASRVALRSSDFYNAYSKAITDDLAPIPSQDLATYLGVAAIANMDVINAFVLAYSETMIEDFKGLSELDKKEVLKLYKSGTELFATDLLLYFASFEAVPQYSNMVFFEGIPGSGKSGGVYRAIKTIVNHIDPSVLKGAIYAHTTEDNAKSAADNIQLQDYVAMDKEKLMRYISSEWRDVSKNSANKNNEYYLYDDSYDFVDGKLVNKWKINKVSDAPRVMFIDEITHYNLQELSMLELFARENGTVLLLAGDMDQSKQRAYTTKAMYKGNPIDVSISRNYFPRVPKLGLTLRTLNRQMNHNVLMMQSAISRLKNGEKVELSFTYVEDDKNNKGLFGVKTASSLNEDTKKTIDTIFSTAKDKVGFVYHSTDSELYKYLMGRYADLIDAKHINDALGREGLYYIVEPNVDINNIRDNEFIETLYTGITRSELGVLVITPSQYGDIGPISSKVDAIFLLLSWRELLLKVLELGKKDLAEIAESFESKDIVINKPSIPGTTIIPPVSPGTTPPIPTPPAVPPTPTGMTREEALRELDIFETTYTALGKPIAVRTADNKEFEIDDTSIIEEGSNWTPYVSFTDGTIIKLSDFNKEYLLVDKTVNQPIPIYNKGEKLTIDESGNISNIIINSVESNKNPIEYTISDIDGTNTRTITLPELLSIFKDYYKETEPEPESEDEFLPDDDRAFDSPEELETSITNDNATELPELEKHMRMLHKLYSFNAFEMGISLDKNGKVTYDKKFFDRRRDNAIGLIHLLGLNPDTITEELYKNLENILAEIHNEVESETDNSMLLLSIIRTLRLPKDENYNLVYAIKTTAGSLGLIDDTGQFYQGEEERLSHIYAKNEESYIPKKLKLVLLIKNGKDTVFELTVSTLNSPLTRMQDTDEDGELLYKEIYNAYITAYNLYLSLNPRDPGLSSHLAINDIINLFDNKYPKSAELDLINLFKLYQFTSNGIFYIGNYRNGKFNSNFVYGKNDDYGVLLVKRRGDKLLNGLYLFGNPELNIDTDDFIDLYDFTSNPRLYVSSILSANLNMPEIHKNHALVLVSTNPNYRDDDSLIEAYLRGDKSVKRFYVLPPEATVVDWIEDLQNFFLKNKGLLQTVRGIGNVFTAYRILQRLLDSGDFDIITSSDNTQEQVRAAVQKLNDIESKWNAEDILFTGEVLINGLTDLLLYNYYKQVYATYPEAEQWARRTVRIIELKHYLDSPNNWNAFKVKNDKTINLALTSFLTKAIWKELIDTTTGNPIVVKDNELLKKLENITKGLRLFFKVRKSRDKIGPHGEFTKVLTHGKSLELKYTSFIDDKGKKYNYKINAKIDTPTRGSSNLYQTIEFITKTDSSKPWNSSTSNNSTHRTYNYYFNQTDRTWKLISDPSGNKKTYAQRCWEDYLGISSIFGEPQTVAESIKSQYDLKYEWMDFSVLDPTKSRKENLRLLAARNLGNGRFVFEYNDRLYVLNNVPVELRNLPSYIENTSNSIIVEGTEDNLPVTYLVSFISDNTGNISEVLAIKTHYVRNSINGTNNIFAGILESHFLTLKELIIEYNKTVSRFSLIPNRIILVASLAELIAQLETYDSISSEFNGKVIKPEIFKRELSSTIEKLKKLNINSDSIKVVNSVLKYVENLGNIEENNYLSDGDIIVIGGRKIQVNSHINGMITGIDVNTNETITIEDQDNYLKEETICSPIIWKMI